MFVFGACGWIIIEFGDGGKMSQVGNVRVDDADPSLFQRDLFDDFIELYLNQLESDSDADATERNVFAIVGSAESPAAKSLIRNAKILKLANVNTRIIFGNLSPIESLAEWFRSDANFKVKSPKNHFRWIKNPSLLDAHEQVVLGNSMCWSGDTMKRRPNARDSFELFEDRSLGMARLGRLAFDTLWSACAEIPRSKLRIIDKVLAGRELTQMERDVDGEFAAGAASGLAGTLH